MLTRGSYPRTVPTTHLFKCRRHGCYCRQLVPGAGRSWQLAAAAKFRLSCREAALKQEGGNGFAPTHLVALLPPVSGCLPHIPPEAIMGNDAKRGA